MTESLPNPMFLYFTIMPINTEREGVTGRDRDSDGSVNECRMTHLTPCCPNGRDDLK